MNCSSASQEMPQLQITDQAKHVWRWASRGINSPPLTTTHPQCTDPSRNLHYWERKYYQLPTNKHLPISRAGIAFVSSFGKKKCVKPAERGWEEKIRRYRLFTAPPPFFFFLFTYFAVFALCLSLATGSCPATHPTPHQATLMEPKSCL